jgi:hypothetical protein
MFAHQTRPNPQTNSIAEPADIAEFVRLLQTEIPDVKVEIDPPGLPEGEWWLDLSRGGFETTVAWRPAFGFGIFTSEPEYGDRPDEIYRNADKAARRICQLEAKRRLGSEGSKMWLKDLRSIIGEAQVVVAERLHIKQAAVSRLESRSDLLLSSLVSYVEAIGGHVEMRVRFDDFETGIEIPPGKVGEAA